MDPILIIDDEKDNLGALQRLLRPEYNVTTTTSPFDALKMIQKTEFNVIVSDQRMPEMTGVDLFEKIKNITPVTTRVLLTGYSDIESIVGAINRGHIYRYIAKPWDPEELKQTLRQANEAYHLRKELGKKNEALAQSNTELQKALADLKLLDQAKARFLSLISHELNTPLTVLNSFIGLLQDKKNHFPEETKRAVAGISNASERFSEIVAEVLTYVKLELDDRFESKKFDLGKESRELVLGLEKEVQTKKVKFVLDKMDGFIAQCDPEKMRVALRKLFEEAILHSPSKAEIKVSAQKENGKVALSVWRSGEPLSSKSLDPLEMPGKELHHHKGLGLSLAICKLIVEGHGGKITLKSDAKSGTTIRISLPG